MISSDVARFALGDRLSAVPVDCRERVGSAVVALSRLAADSATAAGIAKRSPIFSLYGGDRWLAAMMACFDTWFVSAIPPNDWPARTVTKRASGGLALAADLFVGAAAPPFMRTGAGPLHNSVQAVRALQTNMSVIPSA